MKDFLEKRFRHRTWFKEGVTVGFALDYFAKTSDFYLNKKPALKQSENLLDAIIYDDTITDGRSFYRLSEEEKQLCYAKEDDDKERIDYWKNQVEIRLKKHNFIDSFINKFFDKVVTNKDFMEFKDRLKMELETI